MPKVAPTSYQAVIGPVGASQGQSGSVKTTLNQYEYELVYFGTPFVFQISQSPKIARKLFCIQNLQMDFSFPKIKNGLEFFSLLLRYLTINSVI